MYRPSLEPRKFTQNITPLSSEWSYLYEITMNTPAVEIFELQVFCQFFAVLLLGDENKN